MSAATLHTSSSFRLWSDRIDGGTITRYQWSTQPPVILTIHEADQ